jgi:hypothetical protein
MQTFGTKSVPIVESETPSSTSSLAKVDQAMVKKQILNLYEYWKAPKVIDKDITNFHDVS